MGGFYNDDGSYYMPAAAPNTPPYHATKGRHGSPAPQQFDQESNASSNGSCYHYNPYNTECSRVSLHNACYPSYAAPQSSLPYGTLHLQLEGYVSFVPYPTEEFHPPTAAAAIPKEAMARVFIGQLPYQVTDMQLDWLCYTFGRGAAVHHPERITKHDPMRGCKVPTGCIHAYCDNEIAAEMLSAMHKRLLVDDSGVWYAETPEQQNILTDYCQMMKNDRTRRFQNRPYDTVVAQYATSSYVPAKRR